MGPQMALQMVLQHYTRVAQVVVHGIHFPEVAGSSPAPGAKVSCGGEGT